MVNIIVGNSGAMYSTRGSIHMSDLYLVVSIATSLKFSYLTEWTEYER